MAVSLAVAVIFFAGVRLYPTAEPAATYDGDREEFERLREAYAAAKRRAS